MTASAPDPEIGEPVRVAVLGSCVSRDCFNSKFNPDYRQSWDCVLTQMQSSIISMMSPGFELSDEQLGDIGDYKRRVVRSDVTKEFLQRVVEESPDYVILDFFGDIHFGCLRLPDGRYITNNRWQLWKTPYYKSLKSMGPLDAVRIQDDPEAYFELWRDAFDRLMAHLHERVPGTRVVLNRGFNTDRVLVTETGTVVPLRTHKKVWPMRVRRMNALWARLDDYAAAAPGVEVVDLTARGYTSFDEHPWGPFYVHYTLDYYRDFLGALGLVHVRRTLLDRGLVREAAILDASTAALEAREQEARTREDRQRVRGGHGAEEPAPAPEPTPAGLLARVRRGVRRGL